MDLTTKNTIFIDESTIKATKNAPLSWQLKVPGLEKRRLVGRYSHPLAVHVIGGISRRGATKLFFFNEKNVFVEIIYFIFFEFLNLYINCKIKLTKKSKKSNKGKVFII